MHLAVVQQLHKKLAAYCEGQGRNSMDGITRALERACLAASWPPGHSLQAEAGACALRLGTHWHLKQHVAALQARGDAGAELVMRSQEAAQLDAQLQAEAGSVAQALLAAGGEHTSLPPLDTPCAAGACSPSRLLVSNPAPCPTLPCPTPTCRACRAACR